MTHPFFCEIDALIAISTRPAGRRPPNNMALATVSVSRSTTELDVTPRPASTLRARAFLDKIARQPYQPLAFDLLAQSGLAGAQHHQLCRKFQVIDVLQPEKSILRLPLFVDQRQHYA